MSRRETVVNTLLGVLLVSVFLLPFLLYVVVAEYVLHVLSLGAQRLFPGMANPEFLILAVFSVISLASAVGQLRKRCWPGAFLSFAVLPVVASMFVADVHSPFALGAPLGLVVLLPIFAIPGGSGPSRSQFFLASCAICAVIAINSGLLGFGFPVRIITGCLVAGLAIWFIIDVRQRSSEPTEPSPKDPLSPTHA